jgi:uroporphyrinogen-III synthase
LLLDQGALALALFRSLTQDFDPSADFNRRVTEHPNEAGFDLSNMTTTIPVLLLKTRSLPHDAYEEYFSPTPEEGVGGPVFAPQFVPVLEHRPNSQNLDSLAQSLKSGTLGAGHGGMIFTSQRAVEAWADVVKRVERETRDTEDTEDTHSQTEFVEDDFEFPLYTVGPATARALRTLADESELESFTRNRKTFSPFSYLRPEVLGEHTGNGASLAQYILLHYNARHARRLSTFNDAPRLPFTPLVGEGQKRLDEDDRRLQKKPLLFLVGEQRRDVIPKTLADVEGKLATPADRISVDEVEVYVTDIMESFAKDFTAKIDSAHSRLVVVVVFSPQGCEAMLRGLEFLDEQGNLTHLARERWNDQQQKDESKRYVVVTIGPTTRDHLRQKFGFEADVCAAKPTPQGVGDGLSQFLREQGLV